MTMVRFATLCDVCERRSEEYTCWPSCRDCQGDICPDCREPGTIQEHEQERSHDGMGLYTVQWETVQCRACAAVDREDAA